MFQELIDWLNGLEKGTIAIMTAVLTALLFPFLKKIVYCVWETLKSVLINLTHNKRFLKDYLQWMINANKFISVLPFTLAGAKSNPLQVMELNEIYISLSMPSGAYEGRSHSLEEVIGRDKRIIILGDPGVGKSTLMQYLALQTAYWFSGESKKATIKVEKQIPILIRLNKFHDIKGWPAEKTLISAIKGEIEVNLEQAIPEGFLEKQLKDGNLLILLDAFDELASRDTRQCLAEKVKNLIANYPENQFIVTSRITGYSNQLADAGFDSYTIQKLTSNHIRDFIYKWYENLARFQSYGKKEDEKTFINQQNKQKGDKLLKVILDNERIRQLAINPMLLSLITLVHYIKVRLPDQTYLLYQDCIEILIEQWDSTKEVKFPFLDMLSVQEKKQILQRIAWYMQENHFKSISKAEVLEKVLMSACREISGEKIKEDELDQFLSVIQERTGLLVEKGFNEQGQTEISFAYRGFQEYLASQEIFSKYDTEAVVYSQLIDRLEKDQDWWQETTLLALNQFRQPIQLQRVNRNNPYIVGSIIDSELMFFGRKNIIRKVMRGILYNHYYILGERRSGKTSLLIRLTKRIKDIETRYRIYETIWIDLQTTTEENFFQSITKEFLNSTQKLINQFHQLNHLSKKLFDFKPVAKKANCSDDFVDLFYQINQYLSKELPSQILFVFIMDEFDKINEFDLSLKEEFRSIFMQSETISNLRLIAAGGNLDIWDRSSPFNFMIEVPLSQLSTEEARQLIITPSEEIVHWKEEVINSILEETKGKPYEIQKLCFTLMNYALERNIYIIDSSIHNRFLTQQSTTT